MADDRASGGLLGIHGINQSEVTPTAVTEEWTLAVRQAMHSVNESRFADVELPVVYYADLYSAGGVAQGISQLDPRSQALLREWAQTVFPSAAQGPVEYWIGQLAAAISERLDRVPPWLVERLMLTGARDASDYFSQPLLHRAIQLRLAEAIVDTRPRVLIAHSLGSVVAWETLTAHPELQVELLVTLGSPLGTPGVILPRLEPQPVIGLTRPPGVGRWVNVYHPGDLVAAVGSLRPSFPEVDDEFQIDVEMKDCHHARSYLRSTVVADVVRGVA